TSSAFAVNLSAFAPALLSTNAGGAGQGTILNANGTLNSSTNPTVPDGIVQIIATDLGAVTNQPADGTAPSASAPAETTNAVSVLIGGLAAVVTSSQLCGPPQLCSVGLDSSYQTTVQVPASVAIGNSVPVVVSMGIGLGKVSSNTVTIAVASGSGLAQPVISPNGVVNGASFTSPVVAGGSATIYGTNLA